jgi:short-subunit dehydrogenase
VFGYINLTRAIYAQMKARGHGVIVNDIGAPAKSSTPTTSAAAPATPR